METRIIKGVMGIGSFKEGVPVLGSHQLYLLGLHWGPPFMEPPKYEFGRVCSAWHLVLVLWGVVLTDSMSSLSMSDLLKEASVLLVSGS